MVERLFEAVAAVDDRRVGAEVVVDEASFAQFHVAVAKQHPFEMCLTDQEVTDGCASDVLLPYDVAHVRQLFYLTVGGDGGGGGRAVVGNDDFKNNAR